VQQLPDVFLDTETTGLGNAAQVVEIAIVSAGGEVVLDTFVRPTVPVEDGAYAVHGYTAEQLADAPPLTEIWPELVRVLTGKTVGIYNADYDMRILRQSAEAHGLAFADLRARARCVMREYATFWGEYNHARKSFRWQSLGAAIDQQGLVVPPGMRLHSALADAEMTRLLAVRMLGEPR